MRTKGGMKMYWYYMIAFAVLVIIEISTYNLVTVWVAIAALLTSIYAYFFPGSYRGAEGACEAFGYIGGSTIPLVLSILLLALTKPVVDKMKLGRHPTNADRLIGMEGVIIEDIDPVLGTGQVKVGGQIWSAKSDSAIPKGVFVKIIKIEGVKLVCCR